jgi:hypothetical protein
MARIRWLKVDEGRASEAGGDGSDKGGISVCRRVINLTFVPANSNIPHREEFDPCVRR